MHLLLLRAQRSNLQLRSPSGEIATSGAPGFHVHTYAMDGVLPKRDSLEQASFGALAPASRFFR
jgi:hypothetical protein